MERENSEKHLQHMHHTTWLSREKAWGPGKLYPVDDLFLCKGNCVGDSQRELQQGE